MAKTQGDFHVDVWSGKVSELKDHVNRETLNASEQERYLRLLDQEKALEFLCGRVCLKMLIAQSVDADPRSLDLINNKHGKPSCPQCPSLCFNLSHSQGHILIALGDDMANIGIDIEYHRDLDIPGLSKRFLSAKENELLRQIHEPSEKRASFFKIWSRKEACVKAHGQGIGIGLQSFSVNIEDPACILSSDNAINQNGKWCLFDLSGPGYAACLASDQPCTINMHTLQALFA